MVTIYGLVCPQSLLIRYIGKTDRRPEKRLAAHCTESRKRHSHKQRWIAQCLDAGLRPSIWVLEVVAAGERWQDREREWIRKALAIGLSLTNQTAGGEGLEFLDPIAKAEYLAKLSKASRENYWGNAELREGLVEGSKRSWAKDRQARISACMSGWTREAKAKHAETMVAISQTPEFRAAKSEGQRRAWREQRPVLMQAFANPECKAKQSASKKKAWTDPDVRQRMMNRWTPEARAKQAAEIQTRQARLQAIRTPESRAKQAAALKATWAKRKAEK